MSNSELTGDDHGSDLPAGLRQPALRALRGAGLTTLNEVSLWTTSGLSQLHGIDPRAMHTLQEALNQRGLPPLDGPSR